MKVLLDTDFLHLKEEGIVHFILQNLEDIIYLDGMEISFLILIEVLDINTVKRNGKIIGIEMN